MAGQACSNTNSPIPVTQNPRPEGQIDYGFLSLEPLEVVLVSSNREFAEWVVGNIKTKETSLDEPLGQLTSTWIRVRLPQGLKLIRRSSKEPEKTVFEFKDEKAAKEFHDNLRPPGASQIAYQEQEPTFKRNVYIKGPRSG